MFLFLLSRVGKKSSSVDRALLDYNLYKEFLDGDTLDLGAGKFDRYSTAIPHAEGVKFDLADNKLTEHKIDFETDRLPYNDNEYKIVVFLNVIEHLYDPTNVLKEIRRIASDRLIGSVPFIKWYHPDPHDYKRYTNEALERLFRECGYTDIQIRPLAIGPYCTAFEQIRPTLPRILRTVLFPLFYFLDKVFQKLRGDNYKRYVMQYYFVCR